MAGAAELAALKHELAQGSGVDVEELPQEQDLQAPLAGGSGEGTPDNGARVTDPVLAPTEGVLFPRSSLSH